MRLLLAAATALACHLRAAAASDITLLLDLSIFGLDMGGDGGTANLLGTMMDASGNIVVIDDGEPRAIISL